MKFGIIGYGSMAAYHVESLSSYNRVRFVKVFDVNPERMLLASQQGLDTTASVDDLLADREIDAVLIATTNEVHKELSIQALLAGKHVICEKPVTLSSHDLRQIMAVSKDTNRLFTINQNRRTNKDFVLMRRQVESGLLGPIYWIESRVEGSRGMPKGWRTMPSLGGGMMYDWGVHLIDQILFMIQEPVLSVQCHLLSIEYPQVDDNFRLLLTFESGLVAQIEVSTNNYITHPRWYVLGKHGTLQIDDWDCNGKIVRCLDPNQIWENEIVYTKAGPTKTMAPLRSEALETLSISEPLDVVDHLSVVYDNLLNAIEGKEDLRITPDQALRVLLIMEASFDSHRLSQIIHTKI